MAIFFYTIVFGKIQGINFEKFVTFFLFVSSVLYRTGFFTERNFKMKNRFIMTAAAEFLAGS